MAADFVGYTVLVTLKSPANSQVQGVVGDIVGQRLTLHNVTLLWSGQRLPSYHIDAPAIADLELSSQQITPAHGNGGGMSRSAESHGATELKLPQRLSQMPQFRQVNYSKVVPNDTGQPFVDPAILSFKKPSRLPAVATDAKSSGSGPLVSSPIMIADSVATCSSHSKQTFDVPSSPSEAKPAHVHQEINLKNSSTTATLTEPFSNLSLNNSTTLADEKVTTEHDVQEDSVPEGRKGAAPLEAPIKYTGKRSRRGGRGKMQKDTVSQTSGISRIDEPNVTAAFPRKTNPRAKGWRQTAFVEPAHIALESSKNRPSRRSKLRSNRTYGEDPNGWATEDATDIQEMGDFDFETNLSKFDKRRVFDEIRNDDTTADEERLVSFNRRLPRPGTNGGKSLHYSENVLENSPKSKAVWNSDQEETDYDEVSDERFSSGKNSSRARSRTSVHPQSSRKGSAVLGSSLLPSQVNAVNRAQLTSSRTASPRPNKQALSTSPLPAPSSGSLRLTTTNRDCPSVSPLQMLEIEQLAVAELGLTEDMITENAGRGIAEAALSLASDLSASSAILVLAGNHRTGARAASAARHFRNRGYRVTLCVLGIDRENEFLDSFKKQVEIFQKVGGRVMRWGELSNRLSASEFVPELVVDALFGMHIAFAELRTDDQATAFEMISWANRSNIDILSVDIPSGISASSGETAVVEGSHLAVGPKFVVCLGAPKSGLVNALLSGDGLCWQIAVADIGISQVVWRKYGTRRRHGVDFGNQWVVSLRFQAATA